MNSSVDLSDITILILTHNRHNCLAPALQYWNEVRIQTLVLDESEKPLKGLEDYPLLRYFHLKEKFAERCKVASEVLETKYTIVVSDDELYTPSGLLRMKETLEEDRRIVSVGGVALAIWEYGPIVAGSWPYRGTFKYRNEGVTPVQRIRTHTGNGKQPHSAFFTSNLNRTEYLKRCLNLYSKSPVIATEAISILTICGAGRSKYLDELFWIRNWNEFPKSHPNWNRSIYLHDWWRSMKNTTTWNKFYVDLSKAYSEISDSEDFDEVWELVIEANSVSQPSVDTKKYVGGNVFDSYLARYLKYYGKRIIEPSRIPAEYTSVLEEMKSQGVNFNQKEIDDAVRVVRKMRPYKNWK